MDVLSGGNSRLSIANEVVHILKTKKVYVSVAFIISKFNKENTSFIRTCLNALVKKEILAVKGERLKEQYQLIELNDTKIQLVLNEVFGGSDLPVATKQHYELYGFEELVASVAKQINHDGVVVKEYNTDRLWLGRYIDFLELAKEYTSFRESDNQIANKKVKNLKSKTNG